MNHSQRWQWQWYRELRDLRGSHRVQVLEQYVSEGGGEGKWEWNRGEVVRGGRRAEGDRNVPVPRRMPLQACSLHCDPTVKATLDSLKNDEEEMSMASTCFKYFHRGRVRRGKERERGGRRYSEQ